MDRHRRYTQQARWTRALRSYVFEKARLPMASRVLEVGCGTGAVVGEIDPSPTSPNADRQRRVPAVFGIDHDFGALVQCRRNAPGVISAIADAAQLPFCSQSFDIVFCHFLLLWIRDPLAVLFEMKRVSCRPGSILALAEPDYSARLDEPPELVHAGAMQTSSLKLRGADTSIGSRLSNLFKEAGIEIMEAGEIQPSRTPFVDSQDAHEEWLAMRSDLEVVLSPTEIEKIHELDLRARRAGTRRIYVPTHFAWGQV